MVNDKIGCAPSRFRKTKESAEFLYIQCSESFFKLVGSNPCQSMNSLGTVELVNIVFLQVGLRFSLLRADKGPVLTLSPSSFGFRLCWRQSVVIFPYSEGTVMTPRECFRV